MRKRVSEVVTIDDINSWDQGEIITIKAGTGAGKSYFIKNNLYAIAKRDNKKILMLIHRKNCTDQFLSEITKDSKTDIIDIRTYQSIEALERRGIKHILDKYDYIVADEFHYFIGDASFNRYTDISLRVILNQNNAVRIFMSATGDKMNRILTGNNHLNLNVKEYTIPISFSFIKKLEFFYNDSTFDCYMRHAIKNNLKSIFFVQSAQKAYELYGRYKDIALFNCGSSSKYYKYVNKEKIDDMLKNERFEEQILITTTVMDAGVNIVDDELNYIVIDVNDVDSLIQCIGRKRLQNKSDHIILHIKALSGRQLGGFKTRLKKKIEMPLHLLKQGDKSMVLEYFRTNKHSEMVYDVINEDGNIEKELNELMFFKAISDINEMENFKELGKFGYCVYLSRIFNLPYTIYENERNQSEMENYLESVVGKRLMKEDQKKLIEIINIKDGRGRTLKSIGVLNEYFKENKMSYMIISKRTSERINGVHKTIRFWIIINNVCQNED